MLVVRVGDGVSSPSTSISSSSESTGASLLARDSRPPLREKSTGRSATTILKTKTRSLFDNRILLRALPSRRERTEKCVNRVFEFIIGPFSPQTRDMEENKNLNLNDVASSHV